MANKKSTLRRKPSMNFVINFINKILVEIILKDCYTSTNPKLHNLEPIELMALVSLENSNYMIEKDDFSKLTVSYFEGIDVLGDIYKIQKNGSN
jgi:hypothetical protein